jgi:hypothetical protein
MRRSSPTPDLPAAGGEIQALAPPASAASASSGGTFTALLGLPTSQAIELLLPGAAPAPAPVPAFPSDPHLVDRAARFSAFASPSPSPPPPPPTSANKRKAEPASKVRTHGPRTPFRSAPVLVGGAKSDDRWAPGWLQGKAAKKGKSAAGGGEDKDSGGEDEKRGYVHVRARRGQATDSHSLAERVSSPPRR